MNFHKLLQISQLNLLFNPINTCDDIRVFGQILQNTFQTPKQTSQCSKHKD